MSQNQSANDIMERVREQVRQAPKTELRDDGGAPTFEGWQTSCQADLSHLEAEVQDCVATHGAVGQLNPRLPGLHNSAIQLVKKAIRRSLTWYTRPLHHFQGAVTRALQHSSKILESHDNALRQVSLQMERQAVTIQDLQQGTSRVDDAPPSQSVMAEPSPELDEEPPALRVGPSEEKGRIKQSLGPEPERRQIGDQPALLNYAHTGHKQIEGWMGAGLFPLLRVCASVQEAVNEKGGAVEIGVHHGQFFIALNQLCKAAEPSLAIDVFDAQYLNIDGSGVGSLQKFQENLRNHCCHKGSNVKILAADSTSLRASDILSKLVMKPRFFSVDGGHTVEHTLNDLSLANECISDFGVIFVDDILNQYWLGVIEGVCRYLARSPTILPFAINSNKLFLCRLSAYKYYSQAFSELLAPPHRTDFFGKTVLVW